VRKIDMVLDAEAGFRRLRQHAGLWRRAERVDRGEKTNGLRDVIRGDGARARALKKRVQRAMRRGVASKRSRHLVHSDIPQKTQEPELGRETVAAVAARLMVILENPLAVGVEQAPHLAVASRP